MSSMLGTAMVLRTQRNVPGSSDANAANRTTY